MIHLEWYAITQFSKSLNRKTVTIYQPRKARYKTEYGTYAQYLGGEWWGEGRWTDKTAGGGVGGQKREWHTRGKYPK